MKETQLWSFIVNKLVSNIPVIFIVVAETTKSSPGRAGFKIAIAKDGSIFGTIGGGIMESDLINESRSLLNKNESITIARKLHHTNAGEKDKSGLLCGGTQTVIIKSLYKNNLEVVESILNHFQNLETGLLVITPSNFSIKQKNINEEQIIWNFVSDNDWQFEENIGYPDTIYIIGGGHVGLAISKVMSTLDFYIVNIDPREDVFTMKNNTYADKKLHIPYSDIADYIVEGIKSYAVIVTSEHDSDAIVLKTIINKNLKYIGMMGSKSKINRIFSTLSDAGFDTNLFKKIHAPIGMEIEAETPAEIAISIAAEIIKVKNT
ncbi:MAG: XdhC family protein [Ignavibacteriaceae bacterium]|nr:XdhC family protein [Ignavibacteriaceae bacterium]